MSSKIRHTVTAAGRTIELFGNTAKIKEFFPTAEVVDYDDVVVKTVTFRGGTRRRFPGGPTYSSGGGTRTVAVGGPTKNGVLPGYPIKCEVTTGLGPLKVTKVTQFTLKGSFTAAWIVARATATKAYVLRSPHGKPKSVAPGAP
jgi:hypothetical protein